MSVIRVGFVLPQVRALGVRNYFCNLFFAIRSLPEARIQPVIFVGLKSDASDFEGLAEIVRTPILDRRTPQWWLSKVLGKVFPQRDYILYRLFREQRIDLLSHLHATNTLRCGLVLR